MLVSVMGMTSCDNSDGPGRPGGERPGDGETFTPKWDYLVESTMPYGQTFIGTRYLGIDDDNWSVPTPPSDWLAFVPHICEARRLLAVFR